mgnify:CR=1 FL=1|tara:strand:+ start:82138 stop:84453 length:2316 start_codon:yes stop_codon:yes gene_type:complete
MDINKILSEELNVKEWQVTAAVNLLNEGATVPFIARYRKEVTGTLTDTDLRTLEERLTYLTELEERRQTILSSIKEQKKLTPELEKSILAADNKARLEDLYLPYKPKRRTKAQIAIEAGLEKLADTLLSDPNHEPKTLAGEYLNPEKEIKTAEEALMGARHILIERFSENADLINTLRETVWQEAILTSQVIEAQKAQGAKFQDYFEYQEPIKKVPSHRALAIFRGQKEKVLRINITLTDEQAHTLEQKIAKAFDISMQNRPADIWLAQTVEWAWKTKLKLKIDIDLMTRLRESAELDAIQVFAENLHHLLMASPAGHKAVLGLDPGLRTGVKVVVIDETGKLLSHTTIFPHAPRNQWKESMTILAKLCAEHKVSLVSIGNGTASRETDKLTADLMKAHPELALTKIMISEAGASVYSASELAAKEFPDLDVSFRGAVSIARRLQDPLAELVKIDPKAIGVGQYQHDVNQVKLGKSLENVVEDCVNSVGADVNTASVPLLKSIAGLNETVAKNLVAYREENGRFANREEIKKVPRLGQKTYEQAIGFLRIMKGDNPLDASAVHPETYSVVEKILAKTDLSIQNLMGNTEALKSIKANDFSDDNFGVVTIQDILSELSKPGRDPRPEFKMAKFTDGIDTLKDLKPDLLLEGQVTNVTKFGAFVDIGVHQDGLVHISEMSTQYISDPSDVVKVGQIVKVRVLDVDVQRKRIQLSLRLQAKQDNQPKEARGAQQHKAHASNNRNNNAGKSKGRGKQQPAGHSNLGQALLDAMQK